MTEKPCDPFDQCAGLDAKLLISTVLQGPSLAWDTGEISLGNFNALGATVRPYIDLRLEQTWVAKEACYAPVRSILGLAPGETVQVVTSVRHGVEVTSLVERASGSHRERRESSSPFGGNGLGQIAFPTRAISGYGSLLDDIVGVVTAPVKAVAGAAAGLVGGISQLINNAIGGDAPGVHGALGQARNVIDSIERSESQLSRSETVREDETIQTVTRTFSNPYRDRSLQLRFIPTFRRFEVSTFLHSVRPGISLQTGGLQKNSQPKKQLTQLNKAAQSMATRQQVGAVQRPLAQLLSHDRTITSHGTDVMSTLQWSESHVREDSLLVPLASATTVVGALNLQGAGKSYFDKAIKAIHPDVIAKLKRQPAQSVHLFIGTHIEAVAGGCILADLPPLP